MTSGPSAISLTADLSRDYNKLLVSWLMPYLRYRLDPGQFGGMKGGSITHYFVLLMDFILANTDKLNKNPKAVLAAYIDFFKGFNRLNHNKILIRLSDWLVPSWLLKIVASFLTERPWWSGTREPRASPTPSLEARLRVMSLASSCFWWRSPMLG